MHVGVWCVWVWCGVVLCVWCGVCALQVRCVKIWGVHMGAFLPGREWFVSAQQDMLCWTLATVNARVRLCVCMCMGMLVCVHACVCVCARVCVCAHACVRVCVRACVRVCACTCVNVCVDVCVCTLYTQFFSRRYIYTIYILNCFNKQFFC